MTKRKKTDPMAHGPASSTKAAAARRKRRRTPPADRVLFQQSFVAENENGDNRARTRIDLTKLAQLFGTSATDAPMRHAFNAARVPYEAERSLLACFCQRRHRSMSNRL